MSVVIILLPVAIAAAGTLGTMSTVSEENSDIIFLPTQMTDEKLLEKALNNYGHKTSLNGKNINLEDSQVIFQMNENGIFDAFFTGNTSEEYAKNFVSDTYEEYTKLVQEQVYLNLLENLKESNLRLESEEVEKDNSIILTLTMGDKR